MKMQTERAVYTNIKPIANLPADEHAKMHSSPDGANNPHSFTFSPIYRQAGNSSSDIVAMFAVATAWDVSMLNLLPENVEGMICVIQNSCNQTVSYRYVTVKAALVFSVFLLLTISWFRFAHPTALTAEMLGISEKAICTRDMKTKASLLI